ncbi:hypothetical protein FOY51_19250 [Antrihabitans cavernicola]|uniref:Uncharacterized protein n=2 Tax=Antrihabitans cavernicola TaxID=2495913 RepID=A0A5A7S9Y3_9NOCA|nr:hypothetical protein FOY51_19250 [Spelaeibacter cavernicola]
MPKTLVVPGRTAAAVLILVVGMIAALAQTANATPPTAWLHVTIHADFLNSGECGDFDHPFSDVRKSGYCAAGVHTAGHTPPFTDRRRADMSWTSWGVLPLDSTNITISVSTDHVIAQISGQIPARSSGRFMPTGFSGVPWTTDGIDSRSPEDTPGGPWHLNVNDVSAPLGSRQHYHVYLNGWAPLLRQGGAQPPSLPNTGSGS